MMPASCDNGHLNTDRNTELQTLEGKVVLSVDDNVDSLLLLSFILSEYGVQVITAASASEGLETFARFLPDVLVCDIAMPLEDGYSLIRKIRNLPPHLGGLIPAIALTACAGEEERRRSLEAGFQRHLLKPIEPDELVAVVASLAGCFVPKVA
jgi:CheY-like chemotaxis protein